MIIYFQRNIFVLNFSAADEERSKVAATDLLIVVYQPLFNSVPSSLQAWIEAVFNVDQQTDSALFSVSQVFRINNDHYTKKKN